VTAATRHFPHQPPESGNGVVVARAGDLPRTVVDNPAMCAARAGVTAVWTGDCSASVELARLAGPRDGLVGPSDAAGLRLAGRPPWSLADPTVRAALYERCLVSGTQFDLYRWVNLTDLAMVWPLLRLPAGVRDEWGRVLVAAQLLDAASPRAGSN